MGPSVERVTKFKDTGPCQIRNYTLRKVTDTKNPAFDSTYQDIEKIMRQNAGQLAMGTASWSPHLVLIRRRFKGIGKTIQVGEIIDTILNSNLNLNIVDYYYGACRVDYSDSPVVSKLLKIAIEAFK